MCKIEKDINYFHKRHTKCKGCNRTRRLKGYYDNKDEISFQQKLIFYERNRDRKLLQIQNDRCIQFKDLILC